MMCPAAQHLGLVGEVPVGNNGLQYLRCKAMETKQMDMGHWGGAVRMFCGARYGHVGAKFMLVVA